MFEAYVTNLGLYPERGAGAGEYLKFPTTVEEVQALFSRIGIDGKQYEEYFITDSDSNEREMLFIEYYGPNIVFLDCPIYKQITQIYCPGIESIVVRKINAVTHETEGICQIAAS